MCLSGSIYNMTALVIKQGDVLDNNPATGSINGRYEYIQDPISGSMERVWIPDAHTPADDEIINRDPLEGALTGRRIECSARGILEGGIRVTATTERFSTRGTLEVADYINFEFPHNEILTRRDRITDIRNSDGELIWIEEESTSRPTVFEVTGVTPVVDPFGIKMKNFTLLERADDQASFWAGLAAIPGG